MSRFPLIPHRDNLRTDHERFPSIGEKAHLVFFDEKSKVRAGCYFSDDKGRTEIYPWKTFDLGLIPDKIAQKGAEAVKAHANKKMKDLIECERNRRKEADRRMRELNHAFEIQHEGIVIRGSLKKDRDDGPRDRLMRLTMTEPFQLYALVHIQPSCFGAAMAGHHTFDADGNLMATEIKDYKKTLVTWYKREQRRRTKPPAHPVLAELGSAVSQLNLEDLEG